MVKPFSVLTTIVTVLLVFVAEMSTSVFAQIRPTITSTNFQSFRTLRRQTVELQSGISVFLLVNSRR